jgi:hypothetical protein
MPIRNVSLVLCVLLQACFGQETARIFVEGIGTGKPDFAPSKSELALLQQRSITAMDHGTMVTFEGVLLTDLLAKVATPTGETFRSTSASYYVVAEGHDGYWSVFAWAELNPAITDKAIYVVTKRNGTPLSDADGPFELVLLGQDSRWVKQLSTLRVEPNATAYGSEQARWIRENLPELESIKVGMTRDQLLKVFMGEGGISTRTWRHYVYRKCVNVKVDVEFSPVGNADTYGEGPEDQITKISKPYLAFTIGD